MMQPNLQKPPHSQIIFNISAAVILCCVGITIYSNTFHSPFQFDDKSFIENLSAIKNLSDIGTIWKFWASRFITFLTFAINYKINGLHVFGYHLVNLIIHLGSSIGVFWLTKLLLSTPEMREDKIAKHANLMAFLAALIFLSHPIQTESVTYIFQRSSCLAGFFYILSLCLYIKSRMLKEEKRPASDWRRPYILIWVSALAAMLTKENAVTLPLMIILCEFCFFAEGRHMRWRYALPFLALLPIIPILLLFTKPIISGDVERLAAPSAYADPHSFLIQFRAMITYIRLSFIPINQNLDYDYPLTKTLFDLPSLASLFALIVIVVAAFKLFKRYRLISFSVFWFFLTILPESSLIHLKEEIIYEHWLYLPMFGYSLFLVSAAYYLFGRNSFKLMVSALIVIVACYSVLTYNRNLVWKDELTLWNDVVLKSPQKARPYSNRGNAYLTKGNFDQAISDCTKAIEIDPKFAAAYNNRGVAYSTKGNLNQTISDFTKAIEINPQYAGAYNNRGGAYLNKGNLDQAISDFTKAIEINPNLAEAYNNRGVAYFNKGNLDRAISDCTKAIEIKPNLADAYNIRGNAYLTKGNLDQAISDYNKAIEIDPNLASAYSNRGNVYLTKGNLDRAISDCTKAIEINPQYAGAYNNRGVAYFNKGNLDRAISDHNKAIEIDPNFASAFNNRGNAYLTKGNLDQAISDCTKAIEIDPNFASAYNNRGVAYFYKKDYDKTWKDVHKAEGLGYKVNSEFIAELKKASGREK